MIGADLAGLPTGDRNIAIGDPTENFFDMTFWIKALLALEIEDVHRMTPRFFIEIYRITL